MKVRLFLLCALVFAQVGSSWAEDRPDHYEGDRSATVEEALANLSRTNARIAELGADGRFEAAEMAEIHQLTYTSENALEKIIEALEELKEVLEIIHLASEEFEGDTVKENVPVYLDSSRALFGD